MCNIIQKSLHDHNTKECVQNFKHLINQHRGTLYDSNPDLQLKHLFLSVLVRQSHLSNGFYGGSGQGSGQMCDRTARVLPLTEK